MIISEREKIILNILLTSDNPLSIKDIANMSKIKERTLYREIKNLEYFLKKNNLSLIKEKSKYYINGDISNIDISILNTSIEQAYSQDNKINLILCDLLFNDETSIKDISEKFYLSYNTVATTINTIEKILIDYKITLIRKKGSGISLSGLESDKRILLISLLFNEIKDDDFFTALTTEESYRTNPFLKFLDLYFLKTIYRDNRNLEIFNLYTDSSIKKILISLNISFIRRAIKLENITESISEKEEQYITSLLNATKQYTNFEENHCEKNFLIKILKTCRLIEQVTYFNDKYSYTLIYKVNLLIKNVSAHSNADFTTDSNLASGLITHIESAIKRYQLKLVEENNDLLEFVIKNYHELYLNIKSEILEIFDEINFSSTELSYIVLHFASSYEQIYRENFIRALVVCSSGIGSSKILGSLIRKNIPEIKNLEYSIPSKLNDDLKNQYDVIISTIKLDIDTDYILVPTILRDEDIQKIKEQLLNVRSFNKIKTNEPLKLTHIDRKYINTILENTEIYTQSIEKNNINKLLFEALSTYTAFKIKNMNTIVENLILRHNKSSVVIPQTNIALFHTLSNDIDEPFIIIYNLNNSIIMDNVLDEKEEVKIFFVMASPNNNNFTEFLGQISIAILDDKILRKALENQDIDFIKTKLELIMLNHIITD